MTWQSGGGSSASGIHLRPISSFGKIHLDKTALLTGHTSSVLDLCFAPFYDNILASASQDNTVRIWNLTDEDAVNGKKESEAVLKGHTKKIVRAVWHPTSDFTLATGSLDKTIKLWDAHNQACGYSFDGISEQPWSIAFNRDGSQIAATCRDRKLFTVDPRQATTAMQGASFDSGKPSRVAWNTNSGKLLLIGNEFTDRCIAFYDPRDLSKPTKKERIDNSLSNSQIHYNAENQIMYVMSKGSQVMEILHIDEVKESFAKLPKFNAKTNLTAMSFMDKTCIDPW